MVERLYLLVIAIHTCRLSQINPLLSHKGKSATQLNVFLKFECNKLAAYSECKFRRTLVSDETNKQEVTVVDIKMPFMSMVIFMVKFAIASIPAMIILGIIFSILGAMPRATFHHRRHNNKLIHK
ncbi:hypothetical protein DR996_24395 [Vibrio owensii]|nr:hypothetical protein DR996_24395 [Vibrio owensii]